MGQQIVCCSPSLVITAGAGSEAASCVSCRGDVVGGTQEAVLGAQLPCSEKCINEAADACAAPVAEDMAPPWGHEP